MTLSDQLSHLPTLLDEGIERYAVPGASVAVLHGDETFECAAGVVNLDTGVEATTDAVFQIGSITKIWTTTLMMQLVDEGLVHLDDPVQRHLPEFGLADPDAAAQITVRQLLDHSSGMDGDFFEDTGRGDDCVERFVLACRALPQLHPPGEGFSYCNAGFVVAGRIIEKLRGMSWDDALRTHLAEPIRAVSLESLPDQMAFYRPAVGHVPDGNGGFRVAPVPFLARSNGPAGATPYGAARDVLQLARLHLDDGVAGDGTRVLSSESVAAMQQSQLVTPPAIGADEWGLGWMLFDWSDRRLIGHDGATLGHNAYLRIVPEAGVAVVLLTNGGNPAALYRRVMNHVLGELCDISLPPLPTPTDEAFDATALAGTYERLAQRIVVDNRDGELWAELVDRRPLVPGAPPVPPVQLLHAGDRLFVYRRPGSNFTEQVYFGGPDAGGRPSWAFVGRRLPRIG